MALAESLRDAIMSELLSVVTVRPGQEHCGGQSSYEVIRLYVALIIDTIVTYLCSNEWLAMIRHR